MIIIGCFLIAFVLWLIGEVLEKAFNAIVSVLEEIRDLLKGGKR